jgi:hypothetical protein
MPKYLFYLILVSILNSCNSNQSTIKQDQNGVSDPALVSNNLKKEDVRPEVELTLLKMTDALKAKDQKLYLKNIPDEFRFKRNGLNLNKEEFQKFLTVEWDNITKTNFYELSFSKFELKNIQAFTKISSRWERLVKSPQGKVQIWFSTFEEFTTWQQFGQEWKPIEMNSNELSRVVDGVQVK